MTNHRKREERARGRRRRKRECTQNPQPPGRKLGSHGSDGSNKFIIETGILNKTGDRYKERVGQAEGGRRKGQQQTERRGDGDPPN
jgi:hypothetical protein